MSISLFDILKCEIKKMISGIGKHEQGNIHPLVMGEVEKYIIELVLQESNFNYLLASRILGISRSTLYRKIESLQIIIPNNNRLEEYATIRKL